MFCYQCEQTAKSTGCTAYGVCGKDPDTAALQDLLVHLSKGISKYAHRARKLGVKDPVVDVFVMEALFTTVTNVNFDPKSIVEFIKKGVSVRDRIKDSYLGACKAKGIEAEIINGAAEWQAAGDLQGLIKQGERVSLETRIAKFGATVAGLQELLCYGLKGTAAYADHAYKLGKEKDTVYAFFHEAMDFLTQESPTVDELLTMNLKCGEVNLQVMEMLDAAHNETFGSPVPTKVLISPVKGKAILVSGHDLRDLENLLKQTEGKGINIYTHGEMLPAHGYPGLKKYKHLVGNYGGAWQDQRNEFDDFPGAILMTTNCIQKPKESYQKRIFTSGLVAWPDVAHISDDDFSPVINAALEEKGFESDEAEKTILVGFGHDAVLGVADKVIEAVKSGKIKHFFLIGGCDGAKPGRDYYTDFAQAVPEDCVILTLACGKYRFNKFNFGDIGGIPRLLDCGQCNDAYSAIKIAGALAEAFNCGINDLPLSLVLSWYEQKAVCILLTLLHLGVKNMRLGPSLPAFVSPEVLSVLSEKFGLKAIGEVEKDLNEALAGH
ncbi:MAG: hydroxylamine reductase [SAR324 cluster bacterium]|uniref:Hydroxylamine reductase n=1 Tax=SAR324 cluster bacterium TaxID=2024889 RepID=A0A7X9IK09_9DELT|nr:hydroxylamine reductase [SAR324 cluster bacterium]